MIRTRKGRNLTTELTTDYRKPVTYNIHRVFDVDGVKKFEFVASSRNYRKAVKFQDEIAEFGFCGVCRRYETCGTGVVISCCKFSPVFGPMRRDKKQAAADILARGVVLSGNKTTGNSRGVKARGNRTTGYRA